MMVRAGQLRPDEGLQGRMRSVQVTGRTKSTYPTWKKMQRHGVDVQRVHDGARLAVADDLAERAAREGGGGSGGGGQVC